MAAAKAAGACDKTARTVFQILRSKQRPAPSRDGVSSPIGIGQQLGFVRVTPDAVRGAASLLGITGVEPLATP